MIYEKRKKINISYVGEFLIIFNKFLTKNGKNNKINCCFFAKEIFQEFSIKTICDWV